MSIRSTAVDPWYNQLEDMMKSQEERIEALEKKLEKTRDELNDTLRLLERLTIEVDNLSLAVSIHTDP